MIEIAPNLWVGSDEEHKARTFELSHAEHPVDFAIVHACKEPYHRLAVGYAPGKAAPPGAEYLTARRIERHGDVDVGVICLNLIDAADPKYVPVPLIDAAVSFIRERWGAAYPVLIHCNKGQSRAPTVALLALAHVLQRDFGAAEQWMQDIYPNYQPAAGMRGFAEAHWDVYRRGVYAGQELVGV